ncbi:FtsX-like permease family protein [Streptomyces sp. NPDC047023]|uniref:ABC transporter permease n=1 Tax=Streptomyces sp. NPDC047023 TaxID=3155139 RepID=UPI0033E60A85
MLRTALRNIVAHKVRLLMTALAIILGVSFTSGTLIYTDSLTAAMQEESKSELAGVSVLVDVTSRTVADDPDAQLPDDRSLGEMAKLPGVTGVRGSVSGFAGVIDKANKLVGQDFFAVGANYAPGPGGADSRYPLSQGRAPQREDEVVLDARSAAHAEAGVGSTVRIALNGSVQSKKLVGLARTTPPRSGTLALFDTGTAQKLYARPGQFTRVEVTADRSVSQTALAAQIAELIDPAVANVSTGAEVARFNSEMAAKDARNFGRMMLVFAGIALFVSVFLIANTFTMLVAQRTREIALLRAIGATRRQVTFSILVESVLVGGLSSSIGLAAGIGVGAAMPSFLDTSGAGMPTGPLVITASTMLTSLAVGIVVTMVSAWLPARRASSIAPVAALSATDAPPKTKSLTLRTVIGSVLTAAGVGMMAVGGATGTSDGIYAVMPGAAAAMFGIIVLAPLLTGPLTFLAGPLLRKGFGVAGLLAARNAARNPRRTAATASSLMVGLTLITSITVVALSMQAGQDTMLSQGIKADYRIQMASSGDLNPGLADRVARTPGVAASSPVRGLTAHGSDNEPLHLEGVAPAALETLMNLGSVSGSLRDLGKGTIVLEERTAEQLKAQPGSTVDVTYPDRHTARLKVAAVYRANNAPVSANLVPLEEVNAHAGGERLTDRVVLVAAAPGAGDLTAALKDAVDNNPLVKVQDRAAMGAELNSSVNTALTMIYTLLGVSVLISVFGIVNTLAMSVFERTREIGMLRALGLARAGVKRMIHLESVVISAFGAVLGIAMGTLIAHFAGQLTRKGFPEYFMVVPWDRFAVFVALALIIGVGAALWPAHRAGKLVILEATKSE